MTEAVEFEVRATAVPEGSRQPHVPLYKDGTAVRRHSARCPGSRDKQMAHIMAATPCKCPIMATTVDDNFSGKKHKAYRSDVKGAALEVFGDRPLLDVLLVAYFTFYLKRPKGHYGSGRNAGVLKDSAPAAPGVRPDVLKLARAAEDALTNVVYRDDALIIDEVISKRYAEYGEPERVIVRIEVLGVQTVGDMVAAGIVSLPEHLAPEFEQLSLVAA